MKLAVTGKGGVGKTTLCALLAQAFAQTRQRVLAVDADPNPTLAACLGFPEPDKIPPITEMAELIEQRTGVKPGTSGAVFKMNPRVDDLPDLFAMEHNGIRVLRMGTVKSGGSGCYCPENALLRTLVSHLLLSRGDVLIMDMEAGVEHFGRATAQGVDWLLIVVEPSRQSLDTAKRIRALAADIGLDRVGIIGNKCRSEEEEELIRKTSQPMRVLGVLPFSEALRRAEIEGTPPDFEDPAIADTMTRIAECLLETPTTSDPT